MNLIAAYGSLMNPRSRPGGLYRTVRLYGGRRSWTYQAAHPCTRGKATFMAADLGGRPSDFIDAVVFEVDKGDLAQCDQREKLYDRVPVHADAVTPRFSSNTSCWLYVARGKPPPPSPEYPILQTYLDVVLEGAIFMDDTLDIARRLLRSLPPPSVAWENDRADPRYARALPYSQAQYDLFDRLCEEEAPEAFAHRFNSTD